MDTDGQAPLDGAAGDATTDVASAHSAYTRGKLNRVPNQPKTPNRAFRISEELYREAQAIAAERGETLTAVVVASLERYVARNRKKP